MEKTKVARLVIQTQPKDEFYKDEGGKANFLQTTVDLDIIQGYPLVFAPIPVYASVCFDNQAPVEVADQQMFKVIGGGQLEFRCDRLSVEIKFRLDKVSRRKDGQKFKIKIELDRNRIPASMGIVLPVYTIGINVLSKRKASSADIPETKMQKVSIEDLLMVQANIIQRIDILQRSITSNFLYMQQPPGGRLDADFGYRRLVNMVNNPSSIPQILGPPQPLQNLQFPLSPNLAHNFGAQTVAVNYNHQHGQVQPTNSGGVLNVGGCASIPASVLPQQLQQQPFYPSMYLQSQLHQQQQQQPAQHSTPSIPSAANEPPPYSFVSHLTGDLAGGSSSSSPPSSYSTLEDPASLRKALSPRGMVQLAGHYDHGHTAPIVTAGTPMPLHWRVGQQVHGGSTGGGDNCDGIGVAGRDMNCYPAGLKDSNSAGVVGPRNFGLSPPFSSETDATDGGRAARAGSGSGSSGDIGECSTTATGGHEHQAERLSIVTGGPPSPLAFDALDFNQSYMNWSAGPLGDNNECLNQFLRSALESSGDDEESDAAVSESLEDSKRAGCGVSSHRSRNTLLELDKGEDFHRVGGSGSSPPPFGGEANGGILLESSSFMVDRSNDGGGIGGSQSDAHLRGSHSALSSSKLSFATSPADASPLLTPEAFASIPSASKATAAFHAIDSAASTSSFSSASSCSSSSSFSSFSSPASPSSSRSALASVASSSSSCLSSTQILASLTLSAGVDEQPIPPATDGKSVGVAMGSGDYARKREKATPLQVQPLSWAEQVPFYSSSASSDGTSGVIAASFKRPRTQRQEPLFAVDALSQGLLLSTSDSSPSRHGPYYEDMNTLTFNTAGRSEMSGEDDLDATLAALGNKSEFINKEIRSPITWTEQHAQV